MAKDRFKPLVIVMVKAPLPGRVKTRLASEIGSTEASRFYRVTAAKIIRTLARDTRWRLALAVAPDNYRRSRFWSGTVTRLAQGTGGLGDRMARILSLPSGCPIVLIGSDIPGIAPNHIASAIRKVTGTTLVIGPSGDGGFWLIARHARPLRRGIFDNVRWSTEFAMADTVRNWAGPVDFAPSLRDVDTIEDYLRWRRHSW
jgi:rSAM/selenodomain-associated transferase 1